MDIELLIPSPYAVQLQALHPDGAERAAVAALRFYLDLGKETLDELLLRATAQGTKPSEVVKALLRPAEASPATTITPPNPNPTRRRTSNAERDKLIAAEYMAGGITYARLAAKHGLSVVRVTQIVANARAKQALQSPTI